MQQVKHIDLSKSYIPGDPNAFPNTLHFTGNEDQPDEAGPILMYEGYNFLPTSYGYRSYFGTESAQNIAALTKPCDEIITFQAVNYDNAQIAFCSDGIYQALAGETVWTKILSLPDDYTNSGTYKQYSWCIIENNLYIYRQGYGKVIKISSSLVLTEHTPSFLNMAGQMGMFRGNGRLCFWDSANSVSWSSALDLFDFTPSIENMVGNSIFLGVLGRIVNIVPHGEGFVIYSTRSIVGVTYSTTGTQVWNASTITSAGGVTHPKAMCLGKGNEEHFVYTTVGIATIGHFNALSRNYAMEFILPELFDFLKESRDPVYLQCHAARYLYFSVINPNYIYGRTSFTDVAVADLKGPVVKIDTSKWNSLAAFPYISPKETYQLLDSFFVEPTGLVTPAVDRSATIHIESRWMATMLLPNLDFIAAQKGLFPTVVGECAYKSRAYDFPAAPTADNFFPAIDFHCNQHSNGGTNGGGYQAWNSWGSYLTSRINADSLYIQSDVVTTAAAVERSVFTKLYSQALKGLETGGGSCTDLIYNFMVAVNEYRRFLLQQEENLRDFAVYLLNMAAHSRKVYSDSASLTFPSPSVTSSSYYMPKAIGHVTMDMIQGDALTQASLAFNYNTTQYLKINQLNASNSKIGTVLTDVTATPAHYIVKAFTGAFGQYSQKIFDHLPTIQDIMDYFGDPGLGAWTTSDGNTWVIDFNYSAQPDMTFSSLANGLNTYCIVRNINTNAYTLGSMAMRLCYDDSGNNLNTDPWIWPNYAPNFSAEFLQDIQDNAYLLNFESVISNFPSGQPYGLLMALTNLALRPAATYQFLSRKTGAAYTLRQVAPTAEFSVDGRKFIIKGDVQAVSGGAIYSNVVLQILYTNQIYVNTVEETTSILLDEVARSAVPDASKDTLQILFTETDRDTITDNGFDGFSRVNNKKFFTPAFTNPGDNLALTFPGMPSSVIYKTPNASFPYSIQNCIPWDAFKNNSVASIIHGIDPTLVRKGKLLDIFMPVGPVDYLPENYVCYGYTGDWDGFVTIDFSDFTYPGATYTLQDGVPVPAYPTLTGSLIFDLQLKKWGKQAANFKALLQLVPVNATDTGAIAYTQFGMDSGVLDAADNLIKMFSVATQQGYCRWGKIGLYRLGFTEILEITFNFRTKSTGTIIIDGSIDGRDLDLDIQHTETFTDVRQYVVKCHVAAMWHTISVLGNFDLQYLEFRAIMASRR